MPLRLPNGCKHDKVVKKCFSIIKSSFFGQKPTNRSIMLFNLNLLYDDLYCCVKNLDVECRAKIFKSYSIKMMLKRKWLNLVLEVNSIVFISYSLNKLYN